MGSMFIEMWRTWLEKLGMADFKCAYLLPSYYESMYSEVLNVKRYLENTLTRTYGNTSQTTQILYMND
jgi:hypothetical protein